MPTDLLLPHGPPVLKSTFTSTYDAAYTKEWVARRAASAQPQRSGHIVNTPLAHFAPRVGLAGSLSTAHAVHGVPHDPAGVRSIAGLAVLAASPKVMATAHVRNQSHIGAEHADGSAPVSTMKDSYALRPGTGGAAASGPRARSLHPGSAAVQFNPRFLAIDSPDDEGVGRSKYHGVGGGSGFSPLAKRRRPREDVRLNISVVKTNPYLEGPLRADAEQRLKVSSPVEYHVHRNQRPYVTQARVIGDTSSVVHDSLSPHSLTEATDRNLVHVVANKRSLLDALSGISTRKERPSSGPARMGGLVHHGARFGGHLPRETEYRDEYFNRWHEPEQPDPKRAAGRLDKAVFVALNKHDIDFSAANALNQIRTSDGSLKSEKPAGVHPSIWLRIKHAESKALSENQDPHRHKRRVQ